MLCPSLKPTSHNTHICDSIVTSREKSHGSAPSPHPSRDAMLSPPSLQPFYSQYFRDFGCFTCCRGLAGRRKPRVPPHPHTTTPVLCPPTNCSLHHHSWSMSQMILIIQQLPFIQQYFTLPSATSVISTLQTLDTVTVLMEFVPLCCDILMVLDLLHNYHQHSNMIQQNRPTNTEKWNIQQYTHEIIRTCDKYSTMMLDRVPRCCANNLPAILASKT